MSSTAAATPSAAALTSPTSLMPICPRLYRASWELLPGPSFPEWATSERAQPPRDNPGWFQAAVHLLGARPRGGSQMEALPGHDGSGA